MEATTPGAVMTKKNIQVLVAIIVALVLTILVVENTDDSSSFSQGGLLLPGFAEQANKVRRVSIIQADTDTLTMHNDSGQWVLAARDNYAVDVSKLRALIIALADANIVEEKTSNPELYEKLGVDDPEDGGSGTKVAVEGEEFSYSVILGESAQGDYRYARLADEQTSQLIDKNPSIADSAGDWLLPDLVDLESNRIRKVVITHEDGDTIVVEKSSEDLTDFTVLDIPQGRELSYSTVGNGIAGALRDLKFDDVRKATESAPGTSVVFETWDGQQVTAVVSTEGDESWVAFSAVDEAETSSDSADTAAEINDRLSGWQYRLPEHKKNLLTRRWEDILKSANND
jgi:hypothetical protein